MSPQLEQLRATVQAPPSQPIGWLASLSDMGAYAGQSPRTIQRWIAAGHLQVRRLSKKSICCKPSDIDAAIRSVSKSFGEG